MDIEGYEKPALAGLRQTLSRNRPVVLFELTVDPALPLLFSSMDDLTSSFPDDYDFVALADRNLGSGAYRLTPLRLAFDRPGRANVVAWPKEKWAAWP